MPENNTSKRIDIWIPIKTLNFVDRIWQERGFKSRSTFLEEAARRYAVRIEKANLKRKLKIGYITRSERDLSEIALWELASSELREENNK